MYNFVQYFSTVEYTYEVITFLFCIGILISSLEYITIRREFKVQGIFSWKIFSSRPNFLNNYLPLKKANLLFNYQGFKAMQVIRIICSLLLPFVHNYFVRAFLILLIAITGLLFSYRNIIGNDGADQMFNILSITLCIIFIADNNFVSKVGLIFIAGQSIAAYVIAGIAKLISSKWRNGKAVLQIMNTKTYGHQGVGNYLARAPLLVNYFLCWHIIIIEMLFFLVIFLPYPWLFFFLIWGIGFHVYNAIAMGLNNFFWAFISTYPAIIFINQIILK